MKILFKIMLLLFLSALAKAQTNNIDSLKTIFNDAPDGQLKFQAANNVYYYYQELNRDSALHYTELQLAIAKSKKNKIAEGVASVNKSYQLTGLGKYADALTCLQQAFAIAEDIRNEKEERWEYFLTPYQGNNRLLLLSYTHHIYALLMLQTENLEQQILHFRIAAQIGKEINYVPRVQLAYLNLGQSYLDANMLDSALYYEKEAERVALQATSRTFRLSKTYLGTIEMHLGDIYMALNNDTIALAYYYKSFKTSSENNNRTSLGRLCYRLTRYHLSAGNKDSALYYSLKNVVLVQTLGQVSGKELNLGSAYENIYLSYKLNNQFDSAFKYQGLALIFKDSLSRIRMKNLAEFQNLTYSEQLRLQTLESEKANYQNKVRTYLLLAGIIVLLLLALLIYRNNRQKHKANIQIEQAYNDLKATQQQLIQSEKMASLGELTAGIAHEIQNPLNFVNNFSEVNTELIDELYQQADNGNLSEVRLIAKDIKSNEEKINYHGKRADSIVKSMLQHSRSTSSIKEPTDINSLCEEFLRLSYHGLRAKHKDFNVTLKTDFDQAIEKINIVPQDIGRVILNLLTNAFYAVSEKSTYAKTSEDKRYEPTVSISTKKAGDKIEIRIADNGNGIPQNIMEKIFQPFFTTKPTGEGTGLGLSLSYDIITKGHGGKLKVESKVKEGTIFYIQLNAAS